jgi:hypothetical protein
VGIYSEYLDRKFSFPDLTAERKKQLRRIAELRGGRDVLVFAADFNKPKAPISIAYADLLPINDQLANLRGSAVDLLLETPGGSGEVAEDIVRLLHGKYDEVGIIVPGSAKSAGTIVAMSGNEILMDQASALGPIDAQIVWQGKMFSADALLEGVEKIKGEVEKTGALNKAYIPILQAISPGELQSAENALKFAKVLVTDWLVQYKFKMWSSHSSTGKPVTQEEKRARAEEISALLCDHGRWLTHGRSIKIDDLTAMGLQITDYSTMPDLADAIRRYYTLLQLSFITNIYKVIETPDSQIYSFISPPVAAPREAEQQGLVQPAEAGVCRFEFPCGKCDTKSLIQANLGQPRPLREGHLAFPTDNIFRCPNCGTEADLSDTRRQIEAQAKKQVVT